MNKKQLFICASLIVMAITGVFVTKANTKFSTVYYFDTLGVCKSETLDICPSGNNHCLDNSSRQVYANSNCTSPYSKQ